MFPVRPQATPDNGVIYVGALLVLLICYYGLTAIMIGQDLLESRRLRQSKPLSLLVGRLD